MAQRAAPEKGQTEGRVLVVDDQASIRQTVSRILSRARYEVLEAESGEQAIRTLNNGDNPMTVDAILCDLEMPVIDGFDAIAYFRSRCPSIPVVVLTGRPDVGIAASLLQRGVMDYLIKPVSQEVLLQVIARAVDKRRKSDEQPEP